MKDLSRELLALLKDWQELRLKASETVEIELASFPSYAKKYLENKVYLSHIKDIPSNKRVLQVLCCPILQMQYLSSYEIPVSYGCVYNFPNLVVLRKL